jgi:hypothetical protein
MQRVGEGGAQEDEDEDEEAEERWTRDMRSMLLRRRSAWVRRARRRRDHRFCVG